MQLLHFAKNTSSKLVFNGFTKSVSDVSIRYGLQPMTKRYTDNIEDIYGSLTEDSRLAYPQNSSEMNVFLQHLRELKESGYFIGLVDGAYDIPTENHVWSLRDCRARLARAKYGEAFDIASNIEKQIMIADDKIILIVTVDADERVNKKKSLKRNKGNIIRPVYSWQQRANRVGGYMIPDGKGKFRPVVDILCVDGDPMHKETPLESHLTFGAYLCEHNILGTWLLYSWHEWYESAVQITNKFVTMRESPYALDPVTGERSTSTMIINRIKNSKVL